MTVGWNDHARRRDDRDGSAVPLIHEDRFGILQGGSGQQTNGGELELRTVRYSDGLMLTDVAYLYASLRSLFPTDGQRLDCAGIYCY